VGPAARAGVLPGAALLAQVPCSLLAAIKIWLFAAHPFQMRQTCT
jgi:hypothetical protein